MNPSEHIQAAVDPALLRPGRPIMPVSPLTLPRFRRLRTGEDIPAVTRQVPAVEIVAGALLGLGFGLLWGVARLNPTDVALGLMFGFVFGLLIGWLIGLFTGATGTLSVHTVLTGMVHILLVLTVVACFVGIVGIIAALLGAAYGPDRRDV
jgi:hypothetical protein